MAEENKEYMPRLRFPEFRKASTWKTFRLGDNCKITASGDLDASAYSPVKKGEYIYPVYSNAIVNNGLYGFMNKYQHEKNNITITARGTLGVAFLRMEHFNGIGRLIVVEDLHDIIPNFLCEYWNYFVEIPIETTSIPQLTVPTVKKISIKVPSLPEQQKIADCLSSLDELIEAHEQKRDALVEHKKGLMQRLFPAEGETTPRWRFPEFRKARKWETAPLNKLVKTITPPKKILTDNYEKSGKVPIIDQSKERISGYTNDVEATVSIRCPVIIFGDHTCIIKYVDFNFAQGADGIKILLPLNIIPRFLYEYLCFSPVIPTGYSRHFSILKEKNIYFPSDVKEQQKIADCLSSLDARIEAEEAKIASLREHKQGLMQRLFPQSL